MDRLQQKNELFMKLGALLNPLQRLVEHPDGYDEQERAEILARYFVEWADLASQFGVFARGQEGHYYRIEDGQFFFALGQLADCKTYDNVALRNLVDKAVETARNAICAIPIPKTSEILEARSPFTAFCKIKDLVEGDAAHELVWVDAYMDLNIFHRFVRGVAPGVAITLVTEAPRANASRRDQDRWTGFLDVSRLFGQERGASLYRLVVHGNGALHDRWLLLDGKRLFHLGGSAKDAADRSYFTVGRLDASLANISQIQAHVDGGKEYFGSTTTSHL